MSNVMELLKPRYKVIADYPKSIYKVGTIIDAGWKTEDLLYCDWDGPRCRDYPHLFEKLEWWEERKPEEMPEYVKSDIFGVCHITKYDFENNTIFWDDKPLTLIPFLMRKTPATKEEYELFKTKGEKGN